MIQTLLALETSCDDTSVALFQAKIDSTKNNPEWIKVYYHKVVSQYASHQPFGGVVPEIAARDHLAHVGTLIQEAVEMEKEKGIKIDACAVTLGPGLIGALMVGVLAARGFATARNIPLIGVNHVDAHLAPALLLHQFDSQSLNSEIACKQISYPALALTVSGGHCLMSILHSYEEREVIGKTLDDACGEAFDKVAKLLGLGYPGGPAIEKRAAEVPQPTIQFPSLIQDKSKNLVFSFSGIKTSVLLKAKELTNGANTADIKSLLSKAQINEICSAFQKAAIAQLIDRLKNALKEHVGIKNIVVAGGVAANQAFRKELENIGLPVHCAPLTLCSDNAVMIGIQALKIKKDGFTNHPFPRYLKA